MGSASVLEIQKNKIVLDPLIKDFPITIVKFQLQIYYNSSAYP